MAPCSWVEAGDPDPGAPSADREGLTDAWPELCFATNQVARNHQFEVVLCYYLEDLGMLKITIRSDGTIPILQEISQESQG